VAPQNVHLTLKFLGDVSPANLKQLAETLKVEAASHQMFSMSAGGLGAFPTHRRARVIWIGLEAGACVYLTKPVDYLDLKRAVEKVLGA